MKVGLIVFLVVGVVLISGCSSQTLPKENITTEPSLKEFKVKITHAGYLFYYKNRPVLKVSVNKGDTVRFLATTDDGEIDHKHGIAIDEYGINRVVLTANENWAEKIEFVANRAGSFRIYCKTCLEGSYGTDHPDLEGVLEVK